MPERISPETQAPKEAVLEALKDLIPGAIADGMLDVKLLAEATGLDVTGLKDGPERFGLMWAGKSKAIEALQTPSMAALAPDMENSINWDTAENVFIEGDNLEVLKLLQKAYNDQVKLIYIDPPYNTGNDFVYNDDFSQPLKHYLEVTGQVDAEGNRLVANTEVSGRKHSNWLTMMYPRLVLARNLLSDDGVLLVSIDENEMHHLLTLVNEVFGESNQLSVFYWKKRSTGGQVAQNAVIKQVEVVLAFARNLTNVRINQLPNEAVGSQKWRDFRKSGGQWQRNYRPKQHFPIFVNSATGDVGLSEDQHFDVVVYPCDSNGVEGFWENGVPTTADRIAQGELRGREINGTWKIEQLTVAKDTVAAGTFIDIPSSQGGEDLKKVLGASYFDNPKPVALIERLIRIGSDDHSMILDFFAGSGTTAEAVLRLNSKDGGSRRFILVNLPEPTWDKSAARSAGFDDIPAITRKRITNVMQNVDGAGAIGLRCFRLAPSSFLVPAESEVLSPSLLPTETLTASAQDDAVAAEVLLKNGVRLDQEWERISLADSRAIVAAGVVIVLSRELTDEIVHAALELDVAHTVIFLEDAFAGRDSVKANAHFAFKQANKTMKTM